MTTVTPFAPTRKPQAITHYAVYGALEGTAELLNGTGWLFRKDGERKAIVVSYTDPGLILLGDVALDPEPATDERPLWMQIADPGYYDGRDRRGDRVRGR